MLGKAAIEFWKLGYEGASIADLTAAIGITPQSLYAAFGSKAELYREAVGWYLTNIGENDWVEADDVVEGVRQLLESQAETFTRPGYPPGCMISTAVLTAAVENVDIAAHMSRLREANVARFAERLQRGIAEGQLRPDTHTTALARFIGAVIQGMAVQARDGADTATLRDIAAMAVAQIESWRA
ncbi:TetR family transcriptional regulator [Devosia nitrariae]|uniref:TetR family transcriptional regulator n=1 Tax=Devosia nitrariae TaxID=2071872 RepID=A0ABQ5WAM9_9HYPH|nr:TetR family transcriptional regulator [Devosia nitrariae]